MGVLDRTAAIMAAVVAVMILESLRIKNVRRLRDAELAEAAQTNIIWGANGSGKTSLLEAIHLLATGRSFRSHKAGEIISHGQASLIVAGTVRSSNRELFHTLGIQKTPSGTRIRVDGEQLKSSSQLAYVLPVLLLSVDSFYLLDGGPTIRRALLDRTLFHVEQRYLDKIKRAFRALQQRNELLRARASSRLEVWDSQFVSYAVEMDRYRRTAVDALNVILKDLSARTGLPDVFLDYRRGWKAGADLGDLLAAHYDRDREIGFTMDGPHRAEVRILCEGRPARQVVSRGQGKLVIAALVAANAELISTRSGCRPVLLIDDLPADLDRWSLERALKALLATGCQIFLTTIDKTVPLTQSMAPIQVFHVEQGKLCASD